MAQLCHGSTLRLILLIHAAAPELLAHYGVPKRATNSPATGRRNRGLSPRDSEDAPNRRQPAMYGCSPAPFAWIFEPRLYPWQRLFIGKNRKPVVGLSGRVGCPARSAKSVGKPTLRRCCFQSILIMWHQTLSTSGPSRFAFDCDMEVAILRNSSKDKCYCRYCRDESMNKLGPTTMALSNSGQEARTR